MGFARPPGCLAGACAAVFIDRSGAAGWQRARAGLCTVGPGLTGAAVAQYAYAMDKASEGQGISALVALGNDKFLVLERNNRGIGAGAALATANKLVYQIG